MTIDIKLHAFYRGLCALTKEERTMLLNILLHYHGNETILIKNTKWTFEELISLTEKAHIIFESDDASILITLFSIVNKQDKATELFISKDALPYMRDFSDAKYIEALSDILSFPFSETGERALSLYTYLLSVPDNEILLSDDELRMLFNMPLTGNGSYMRNKYGFDRTRFEHRVLEPVLSCLTNTKRCMIVKNQDGTLYTKKRDNQHIIGYLFHIHQK